MSSLQDNYAQLTNNGVPSGALVSDDEYTITGDTEMLLTVQLNGGTGTISIDNGIGFTSEDLVEGPSVYTLKACKMKVTLTGGAVAAAS